nr:retrovirus-related Pol polyprotein from transposon TNT 1-94 [Tanacetum cinerariifolium]
MTGNLKLLINFVWKFLGTVCFGNDHVAAILGFDDLQWGNILITRVYFVEGLGHNLFSVGQFCDSDLEVAFRRNACFIRNLKGVDLLKGNRSTNLYTINIHEMASASLICLMARASSTKSWLWHQRLSHLNFDTINDLAKNDLVSGLPKFKYHKEYWRKIKKKGTKSDQNRAKTRSCGHPVNGSYCQGCALLREKLEEYLVTYFQDFQNASESSDDNTNVVNAPREPFVVKQDHGVKSSQNPPHIDECCCECGNALDGIYCQQCICKSCGKAKDHFKIVINSNDDISSSNDDSLYNENIDLEAAEIVIPEVKEIEDDNLREKLLNVHLLIANIEALKDNPTQSFELLTKSSSTSSKPLLEKTNTFHNSLPEFKNFYFDLDEINSGSITINRIYSFKPGLSHRYRAFKKFNTHRSHSNELPMIINGKNTPISDVFLFHFYPP